MASRPSSGVLITGTHRSGSTWVGDIISSSHRIQYIQEPLHPHNTINRFLWGHKIDHFYTHITDYNCAQWESYFNQILCFRPHILSSIISSKNSKDLVSVLKNIVKLTNARFQGCIPLLKDPYALLAAPWLAKRFNLHVIVLIRHPAAFVASLKRMGWNPDFDFIFKQPTIIRDFLDSYEIGIRGIPKDDIIARGALLWRLFHYIIYEYQKVHKDWLFIRHEDLSCNPLINFGKIFDYLDIKYDERIKSRIRKLSSPKNPAAAPNGVSQALARNSSSVITQWHCKLNKSEINLIQSITKPISEQFYDKQCWAVNK